MPKRGPAPPTKRRNPNVEQHTEHRGASLEGDDESTGQPSPRIRRTRFSSVPLVDVRHGIWDEVHAPASVELPRRHVSFYTDSDSESSHSGGGLCSMSDVLDSCKDTGSSTTQPSIRIKHITRVTDSGSRFPKLDECAHFHYDNVELGPIDVSLVVEDEERNQAAKVPPVVESGNPTSDPEIQFCVRVCSNGRDWTVKRSVDNVVMLDRQLHCCVYERKFSCLKDLSVLNADDSAPTGEDEAKALVGEYLVKFSHLAGSLINCGPVLNWLELDNRGNRLIVTDEAAINTPAVAAAYVTKRYVSQANDEIGLEVGDIISVIDMPPADESTWWRGKKGFQVGFFPCECVEIIGDKVPQTIKIPKSIAKPVLRKHGKLIAFFRQFLLSRPTRRKLKQRGILKERVFGCDLGEHLMNSGRDIPLVLKCCAEFIEEHGVVDGIYRLSGVTSNIQKLRHAFDEERVPNLMEEAILQDIHCVASLLKMYFRELPNPLLTFHLYDKFVNAVQADEEIRLLKLRDVVQQLPPPHYRSLEYLMRHLNRVAAFGMQTGMTPKNVAIVWAPNLLRSRDVENGGVGALHVVGVQAVLTEYLIQYTDIIFSEKMPSFPSPVAGNETPRKTRPKSLAISTPTKLLSLEEARSRALTSHLLATQPKFIEVGGGVENLPIKYHTIIDIPSRGSGGKGKKSPAGWKSFFSRGWHTTSGRSKARRNIRNERGDRPKISGPIILADNMVLSMQDKAVTESDVCHINSKKLRTVKSAEALTNLTLDVADNFSPIDVPSQDTSIECETMQEGLSMDVTTKGLNYQKHTRSTSHESYFYQPVNLIAFEAPRLETVSRIPDTSPVEECIADSELQETNSVSMHQPTSRRPLSVNYSTVPKVAQKQKLVCQDTEASSPKVQKLSLKQLYHTMSSPPLIRKKKSNSLDESTEKNKLKRKYFFNPESWNKVFSKEYVKPGITDLAQPHVPSEHSKDNDLRSDELESVSISEKNREDNNRSRSEALASTVSVEATLSETISLSQLSSFESKEGAVFSPRQDPTDEEDLISGLNNSMITPDSPTMDNVSDMSRSTSESSSECNNGEASFENVADEFEFVQQDNQPESRRSGFSPKYADELLAEKTSGLQIEASTSSSALQEDEREPKKNGYPLNFSNTFSDALILSPPESFIDSSRMMLRNGTKDLNKKNDLPERSHPKSGKMRSLERSRTEIHEFCPRFGHGIAASGSFVQESTCLRETTSLNRKRNNDKISPISPLEESRRRFESEIGRLIVRDRQMRLEMEQMKAERQKYQPSTSHAPRSLPDFSTSNTMSSERKIPDTTELKKSPVKKKVFELDESLRMMAKDNQEPKKSFDWFSTTDYSKYLRTEKKPSVKELLSKFESQPKFDLSSGQRSPTEKTGFYPRGRSGTFSNVQVNNYSKSLSEDRCKADASQSQNWDHIFQTECVVRFPHPKAVSAMSPKRMCQERKTTDSPGVFLNSYLASQSSNDRGQYSYSSSTMTKQPNDMVEKSPLPSNNHCDSLEQSDDFLKACAVDDSKHSKLSELRDAKFPSDTNENPSYMYILKNLENLTTSSQVEPKPSVKLKNEFFKLDLQAMDDQLQSGDWNARSLDDSPKAGFGGDFRTSARRQKPSPARQRPRSVPPAVCRLSMSSAARPQDDSRLDPVLLYKSDSDKVPKNYEVRRNNSDVGKSSLNSNNSHKCVKERAAMFERSLSFSGNMERPFSIKTTRQKSKEANSSINSTSHRNDN